MRSRVRASPRASVRASVRESDGAGRCGPHPVEEEAGHVELVAGADADAGPHLVLPLPGKNLRGKFWGVDGITMLFLWRNVSGMGKGAGRKSECKGG